MHRFLALSRLAPLAPISAAVSVCQSGVWGVLKGRISESLRPLMLAFVVALITSVTALSPTSTRGAEPVLAANDRLALVGGTVIERMRNDSSLEYEMQIRKPQWKLRLRNLGWSGDDTFGFARKLFDPNPEKGFQRLMFDLDLAAPTAVLLAYGFAEASNGAEAVARMEPGLTRLVESLLQRQRRVILMRPFPLPGILTPGYSANVQAAADVIDSIATKFNVPVVMVSCDDFTEDGLLPSEIGYRQIALQLADQLVGKRGSNLDAVPSLDSAPDPQLVQLIQRKEELFFHRHRPQNETYLLLFRKHEQGNNAVELAQFDPLVDSHDQQIWERAGEVAGTEK